MNSQVEFRKVKLPSVIVRQFSQSHLGCIIASTNHEWSLFFRLLNFIWVASELFLASGLKSRW